MASYGTSQLPRQSIMPHIVTHFTLTFPTCSAMYGASFGLYKDDTDGWCEG